MARIYLSSTYEDLKDYRDAVARALRRLDHQVVGMEDYVAAEARPLDKCLKDVGKCDVYVGIFAWRYGYVPPKDNPDRKSITELEYREATRLKKPRLIFLLKDDAPWPRKDVDRGESLERLEALRDEIGKEHQVGFFENKEDHLARLVNEAVTKCVQRDGRAPKDSTESPALLLYCERLRTQTSELELFGLGHGVQIKLPIDQAYVPLNVAATRDLRNEQAGRFDTKRLDQRAHCDPNVRLCDVFKWAGRFRERGALLLGDPGAGKTTGARQFCWRVLTEADLPRNLGLPMGTIPVFLRLRNLTPQHLAQGLTAFIADGVAAPSLPADQQPLGFKGPHGFTKGGAGNAQLFGQFRFRGELVTRIC